MNLALGVFLASLVGAPTQAQTPPIFNPGAPGTASRVISAEEAVALSRTTFSAADVAFMQHMIVHHAQALEMVELLREQGSDGTVKRLGERIALSQEAEMAIMREWLTVRGQPVEMAGMSHAAPAAAGGHDHHAMTGHAPGAETPADDTPVMPGMLSPRQMRTLAAAGGAAFDKLFLEGMIQHHQGALDMVDDLMATPDAAEDPTLSDFTSSVVADQSAEILRMQMLLSDL